MILCYLVPILVITATSTSSFLYSSRALYQSKCLRVTEPLRMARSFKPTTDAFNLKIKSKKTSKYSMPGYSKGDLDNLKVVFNLYAITDGKAPSMSFESFVKSKYLRFWPGSSSDGQSVWNEVTDNAQQITIKQLPHLLSKLDKIADKNEMEMELERQAWDLDDLNHELLESFFEQNAVKNKLSFNDFMSWETIRDEIWYNEKGLSEKGVAEIWENIAGCVSREVDKATFVQIYQSVCSITYEL